MIFDSYSKILIFLLALFDLGLFRFSGEEFNRDDWVKIEVDTKRAALFSLIVDRTAQAGGLLGAMKVEIKKFKKRIVGYSCKLRVCINLRYIHYADRLSVFLPNNSVVRIEGKFQNHRHAVIL